jgi:hypothetical protein
VVERHAIDFVGVSLADRFPGVDEYGLGTAFYTVGNEFFEIVYAAERGTAADKFIDRRGGTDTGFIVMLEVDDLTRYRTHAHELGLRIVDESDTDKGAYFQLHPKDTAGTYVALYQMYGDGAGEIDGPWMYGGDAWRDSRNTDVALGICGAEIQSADPQRACRMWSDFLGVDVIDETTLLLQGSQIQFVEATDGRGDGLSGCVVVVRDPDSLIARASEQGILNDDGSVSVGGLRVRYTTQR